MGETPKPSDSVYPQLVTKLWTMSAPLAFPVLQRSRASHVLRLGEARDPLPLTGQRRPGTGRVSIEE